MIPFSVDRKVSMIARLSGWGRGGEGSNEIILSPSYIRARMLCLANDENLLDTRTLESNERVTSLIRSIHHWTNEISL